jgi:hypothetical protein
MIATLNLASQAQTVMVFFSEVPEEAGAEVLAEAAGVLAEAAGALAAAELAAADVAVPLLQAVSMPARMRVASRTARIFFMLFPPNRFFIFPVDSLWVVPVMVKVYSLW